MCYRQNFTFTFFFFATGVKIICQGWVSKIRVLEISSNNMTGLAFYECSLAEKKNKFLPSVFSLPVDRACSQRKPFLPRYPQCITSLILLWKHCSEPGSKTAPANPVLQQVMCCALFDSRAVETQSSSVPSSLQVLGAHFINTCWECVNSESWMINT